MKPDRYPVKSCQNTWLPSEAIPAKASPKDSWHKTDTIPGVSDIFLAKHSIPKTVFLKIPSLTKSTNAQVPGSKIR